MSAISLNHEQELAASHVDGPCLVTACPGSGKTRVIVERTGRLIQTGIKPQQILSITFTNKAANEMKERVATRLGDVARSLLMSTIHAFCAKALRRYGHLIGYGRNLTILDEDDQEGHLAQVARSHFQEWDRKVIGKLAKVMDDCREGLLSEAEMQKRLDKEDEEWFPVVQAYLKRIAERNMVDFSGLLTETLRMLRERSEGLEAIQERFRYLQVDECQDTNAVQFKLIEEIGAKYRNMFIVGDVDQSIYRFRGARPDNIADFIDEYHPRIIRLGLNYRSTPQIVAVADKLIRHNPNRPADEFRTENPSGPPVEVRKFRDADEEARWVARECRMAIAGGLSPREIVVLYRMNKMSRAIEMAMNGERVPCQVIGGFSFFDRKEIKDHICMLRLLVNPFDGLSFSRIAATKTGFGEASIGRLEKFAEDSGGGLIEACRRADGCLRGPVLQGAAESIAAAYSFDWKQMPLSRCLHELSERLHYSQYIQRKEPDTAEDRKQNVLELVEYAARFGGTAEQAISSFLDEITLMTSVDKQPKDKDVVSLMTLHCCKGLEFHLVFMIGVEEGILPHKMAMEEWEDGDEEERRLAYVGATRSRHRLCLTWCDSRQSGDSARRGQMRYDASRPSRFLEEMGLVNSKAAVQV